MSKRIAIMQPYFIPYAGYFRLFAAVDMFVVYDCVQFPRRGWVHRNQLPTAQGTPDWLTLPIKKCPQSTLIKDLAFADDAQGLWETQCGRFPLFTQDNDIARKLRIISGTPLEFIEQSLKDICATLGIERPVMRSSSLNIHPQLKAQERIIAIAQACGATHYVNAPGGRELYEPEAFARTGITLEFLPDYLGSYDSILQRLHQQPAANIRDEIMSQCHAG